MPRIKRIEIALDTETTGIDLRFGARPFLVTIFDGEETTFWEWAVDPLTRKPIVPKADLMEIQDWIDRADRIVCQNIKFDFVAMRLLFEDHGMRMRWDWSKSDDTLLSGHLLASNQPHDLTSMSLYYLGADILPYEEAVKKACNEARRIARSKYPTWRIASKDLPEMPSAKESVSKFDMWLPREIAKAEGYIRGECEIVHLKKSEYDVRIDRQSKWGNPFIIGKDGDRHEVINKYRRWIKTRPELIDALPELDGKRLGCWCSPQECHGDVLKELLAELRHPWWTVTSDYANADSAVTLPLHRAHMELIKERGLEAIYKERLKLLPIVCQVEDRGVTVSSDRLEELRDRFIEESEASGKTCVNIAKSFGFDLSLPKSGNNKSLTEFVFGPLGMKPLKTSKKTGNPSLDKGTLDVWETDAEPNSKAGVFIRSLKGKRKRDTACAYMDGYARFWHSLQEKDWYVLHPSLNPTGTHTLRWSSSNPNEQNCSKQEGFNLRYAFGPSPGREWWSLDAKNIELRIPAYKSQQVELIELFERPNDPPYYGSTHLLNFHTVYSDLWEREERDVGFEKVGPHCKKKYAATWYQWCKNGGFCKQYGGQEALTDATFRRPGAYRMLAERFSKLERLNQSCIDYANRFGYVETLPDRTVDPKRGYPLMCTRSSWGDISPTIPLNYMTQGSACWVLMRMMILAQEYLDELNRKFDSKGHYLIMQIHDEIVLDFPFKKDKGNLPKLMELKRRMDSVGSDLVPAMPLPVGIEYHESNWSEGETLA